MEIYFTMPEKTDFGVPVKLPDGSYSLAGDIYFKTGIEGFTGFVDWLKTTTKQIVGLRYWPFETATELIKSRCSGINFDNQTPYCFLGWFSACTEYAPAESDDQSMSDVMIVTTPEGRLAIIISCDELTQPQTQEIQHFIIKRQLIHP
jgi:hypothetical protein